MDYQRIFPDTIPWIMLYMSNDESPGANNIANDYSHPMHNMVWLDFPHGILYVEHYCFLFHDHHA